jgi:pSer/pThr/pTyr-binding forkhead associated (FHA) protein
MWHPDDSDGRRGAEADRQALLDPDRTARGREEMAPEIGWIHVRWAGGEKEFPAGATVQIGRDPDCEIVLDNPNVSRVHAELHVDQGVWVLTDAHSTQGIHQNGQRVETLAVGGHTEVVLGDETVGERLEIEVETTVPGPADDDLRTALPPGTGGNGASRPGGALRAEALAGATVVAGDTLNVECAGRTYVFEPGTDRIIGRDDACDVVAANPIVSRRHARLRHTNGGWRLEDLGSSRGTYLDGHKIRSTHLEGSTAVWLGEPESGERVVLVTAGERRRSLAARLERAARSTWTLAAVTLIAVVAVVAAGLALFNVDTAPGNNALARATVNIIGSDRSGSGSIVDAQRGLVLTSAHVVAPHTDGMALETVDEDTNLGDNPKDVLIAIAPGLDRTAEVRYRGEVVAVDGYLDLAVVKLTRKPSGEVLEKGDLDGLTEIRLGNSDAVNSGADVRVVGYPGVSESDAPNLTRGVVTSPVRDDRLHTNRAYLNVDADVNPGNSGGMAVSSSGRLIGIPTLVNVDEKTLSKVGRIRPVNFAKPLIDAARTGRPYSSPYVVPLTGNEKLSGFTPVVPADHGGFSLSDAHARPVQPGDRAVAVSFDFSGFGHRRNGNIGEHQDVRFDVAQTSLFGQQVAGRATTNGQYPFVWPATGRATVTIPVENPLQAGESYHIVVYIGPNYHRYADLKLDLEPATSTAPSPLGTP